MGKCVQERLKAFYEGFMFLPNGLIDLLGTIHGRSVELKAEHYIKFPDYDDTD